MQRVMIAGTGSGCGKTTVTCALLSALHQRKMNIAAFKCGPDYIDPMFYREILGTPSHNLDSFFCSKNTICETLEKHGKTSDFAVIEGVMGFYDGADGSAYRLSELTNSPVILVLNCRGMKESIGAVMQGFLQFHTPNRIAGFIFNQLPERLIPFAQKLCSDLQTNYYGCLPKHTFVIENRHLGLVTASEITDLHTKMEALGKLAEQYIYIDQILKTKADDLPLFNRMQLPRIHSQPVIAIAKDHAFCFLYEENLSILREIGCKLTYFSPLNDSHLPKCDGIILCGGYPELYAEQLSENDTMKNEIKYAISSKMPIIAECGGFMYLHSELLTESGTRYPMVNAINGCAFQTKKLQRFGYLTMKAKNNNLICSCGDQIKAHEFHYYDSTNTGNGFSAIKTDGRTWECCHVSDKMYAGFPHLYFQSDTRISIRYATACAEFGGKDGSYHKD